MNKKEKIQNNIAAISALKGNGTKEAMEKYIGWGGLPEVFDNTASDVYKELQQKLRSLLTPEEFAAAKRNTLDGFYTPESVIDFCYKMLSALGFNGGNVLEPSCGTGRFLKGMPDSMKTASKLYGIECDPIAGGIASKTTDANIQIKKLEETDFSNNFFDLAIGNVPFGDIKVYDKTDKYLSKFLVHDYFICKSINLVRPGGLVCLITSTGTMDKKTSTARRYMLERAEVVTAVRLPNNTFSDGGTSVTTDIIVLRKRESATEQFSSDFLETRQHIVYPDVFYNTYYEKNPYNVLGMFEVVNGRFGHELTVVPYSNEEDMKKSQDFILNGLKASTLHYVSKELNDTEEESEKTLPADIDVKNFSYTIADDGEVYYRVNSVMYHKEMTEKNKHRVEKYLAVLKALRKVIDDQVDDKTDAVIKIAQTELKSAYNDFIKHFGIINSTVNRRFFRDDANYPLLSSLEELNEKGECIGLSDVFNKRTVKPPRKLQKTDDAKDALIMCISEKSVVDFNFMERLTGKTKEELISELGDEIFLNINGEIGHGESLDIFRYVPRDEYLSGNIVQKIKWLKTCKDKVRDEELAQIERQEKTLIDVLPEKIPAEKIQILLGSTWIPEKVYEKFIVIYFDCGSDYGINVELSPTGQWHCQINRWNPKIEQFTNELNIKAAKVVEKTLNLQRIKIYKKLIDETGKDIKQLDKDATLVANGLQDKLKDAFKKWVFSNSRLCGYLEDIYNEKFNAFVPRQYDGSYINFDGMNQSIRLRKHQKDAIARILYGGNTLLAHVVGAGKSFEMIAAIMEAKRLGLSHKALLVVPNHLVNQMASEFFRLYPTADIIVTSKRDFEKNRRRRFISKIALSDCDAVIMGHSQFERIKMSPEYCQQFIRDEIESLDRMMYSQADQDRNWSVKRLEQKKTNLKAKLDKLMCADKKDDVITFEELGIDRLFVDEAHAYKNLSFNTKMNNVAGISTSASQRSTDMLMKCLYMSEKTHNKGVILSTGTPVSNSMTEMYTMMRYLMPDQLEALGLGSFDEWASTFGETIDTFEMAPEGNKFRLKTRFARFYNLPELMSIFRQVADIQTEDSLDLNVPEARSLVCKTEPSEHQKEFLKVLGERADAVRDGYVDPTEDNMLAITNDGKKLALDQRLIDPRLPDVPNSKVNKCTNCVYNLWKLTKKNRLTQLVFSDMSVPKKDCFNIYDDIKAKLIRKGIPAEEIAFIHDAKNEKDKESLFESVRQGKVRVLMGSTQKMGTGTNVQDRLIAMHDLDVPWRPSDLKQRAGRIVRQGNHNKKVLIFRYVCENTFDGYLWQTLEKKQTFISQIMTAKMPVREVEDIDEATLSYAEIKALATGNPLIKEKVVLENEIKRLLILRTSWAKNQAQLRRDIQRKLPEDIQVQQKYVKRLEGDLISIEPKGKNNTVTLDGVVYDDRQKAGERLLQLFDSVGKSSILGSYRGCKLEVFYDFYEAKYKFALISENRVRYEGDFSSNALGNLRRMDNALERAPKRLANAKQSLSNITLQLENAKAEIGKPFEQEDLLVEKEKRLEEINRQLDIVD